MSKLKKNSITRCMNMLFEPRPPPPSPPVALEIAVLNPPACANKSRQFVYSSTYNLHCRRHRHRPRAILTESKHLSSGPELGWGQNAALTGGNEADSERLSARSDERAVAHSLYVALSICARPRGISGNVSPLGRNESRSFSEPII